MNCVVVKCQNDILSPSTFRSCIECWIKKILVFRNSVLQLRLWSVPRCIYIESCTCTVDYCFSWYLCCSANYSNVLPWYIINILFYLIFVITKTTLIYCFSWYLSVIQSTLMDFSWYKCFYTNCIILWYSEPQCYPFFTQITNFRH